MEVRKQYYVAKKHGSEEWERKISKQLGEGAGSEGGRVALWEGGKEGRGRE